jgi:hypothetical protein
VTVLLLKECFLLLFISLSTQSGNFWIYPRTSPKQMNSELNSFYLDHWTHKQKQRNVNEILLNLVIVLKVMASYRNLPRTEETEISGN